MKHNASSRYCWDQSVLWWHHLCKLDIYSSLDEKQKRSDGWGLIVFQGSVEIENTPRALGFINVCVLKHCNHIQNITSININTQCSCCLGSWTPDCVTFYHIVDTFHGSDIPNKRKPNTNKKQNGNKAVLIFVKGWQSMFPVCTHPGLCIWWRQSHSSWLIRCRAKELFRFLRLYVCFGIKFPNSCKGNACKYLHCYW